MKRIILLVILAAIFTALRAEAAPRPDGEPEAPVLRRNPYTGYSWRVDEEGDTVTVIHLADLTVFPPMQFRNRRDEEFYWRTVRDVKLTLPYAKLIAETLIETYEYIETFATQAEREQYLKDMEKSLFEQYKPVLRRFSKRQAKVLIKLIQRETHQSSYEIVRAFLGTFRASFWQGFGKLFGVSLKSEFRPATDSADATLDRIARCVEQGTL
ncbi:MAG: DUF4294 domain-containing protein [Muribaculaceae bacterium]|nr:DUF4294 domain-containing protein [Muribaculaceae bacterium]